MVFNGSIDTPNKSSSKSDATGKEMDSTQIPTEREIEQARAAIAEYNAAYEAGGEIDYPHWAADVLKRIEGMK